MATVYVVTIGSLTMDVRGAKPASQVPRGLGVEAVFSTIALARKFAWESETADGEKRSIEPFELDGIANPRVPWRTPRM
jgi:hypothetical protein